MNGAIIFRKFWTLPIILYRYLVSPLFGGRCIYTPSCSRYAEEAILRHGVLKGVVLAAARIGRCAGGLYIGGEDPVPDSVRWSRIRREYKGFRIPKSDPE
jgi:uncharacterized protein